MPDVVDIPFLGFKSKPDNLIFGEDECAEYGLVGCIIDVYENPRTYDFFFKGIERLGVIKHSACAEVTVSQADIE